MSSSPIPPSLELSSLPQLPLSLRRSGTRLTPTECETSRAGELNCTPGNRDVAQSPDIQVFSGAYEKSRPVVGRSSPDIEVLTGGYSQMTRGGREAPGYLESLRQRHSKHTSAAAHVDPGMRSDFVYNQRPRYTNLQQLTHDLQGLAELVGLGCLAGCRSFLSSPITVSAQSSVCHICAIRANATFWLLFISLWPSSAS
ncbi:hypothetical protein K488DRAFT_88412 [Vararia minispora EC-137]|uniref:Uncharacterized protein n=1 Tax=Vararia minispora EC-137 TaxID=1314806 RepID=A0ACB8QDB6_9AGAM|nr:hypothetical protein K488DRAFT_88412 [Vararia minispora EC-137]